MQTLTVETRSDGGEAFKQTPTALKPLRTHILLHPKIETRAGCSHACAASLIAEQLKLREVAPIFSPMLDGGMERQTDSSCTRNSERWRGREGGRERESVAVKGRKAERLICEVLQV